MSKEINLDGYRLAHTMIRVKNLEASFDFYCKTLGMKILRKTDYQERKFNKSFICYGHETE
jgi:lactoylglutathione lyase